MTAPGRYVMAPQEEDVESNEELSESDESNEEIEPSLEVEPSFGTPKAGFQMPKLPKMGEKKNAHEKLVEWRKYKRTFDYYFKLAKQPLTSTQKLQILYLGGGPEIQKALEHFEEPTHGDDSLAYEEMLSHMNKFFQTGVDSLAYMLQFFNMKQKEDEPFADFAQRLKSQADLCELGTARDNMLKTQIQKGAKNAKVFASAESWVNKSVEDIIGLGIADETGSLPSSKSKQGTAVTYADDEEVVGRVYNNGGQTQSRFPRAWRRDWRGGQRGGRYGQGQRATAGGSQRQYPYSSGQSRSGTGGGNTSEMRCFSCNKVGHFAKDCRSRGMYQIDDAVGKVEENRIYE